MNRPIKALLTLFVLLFCSLTFAIPTTPSSDFIDNKDGTVTHKTTGMTWMRCAMGQTWDGTSCTGDAILYTYDQALALKTTFAGKNGWHVPTIAQLDTIIERENVNPTINTSLFPNSPSDYFWSSSPATGVYSDSVWVIVFYNGQEFWSSKYNVSFVRLVRGGQCFRNLLSSTPNSDFIDNQDGTVTHKCTGLTWQRCSVGQIWNGTTCTGTAQTYTYDNAIALKDSFAGNSDWRVPNANELHTIVEYGSDNPDNPIINTALFPNTPLDNYFWSSSTSVADYNGNAWIFGFQNYGIGNDAWDFKSSNYFVRLVRGGQCFGILACNAYIPNGTISGDANGFIPWVVYGDFIDTYLGVTAYVNNLAMTDTYQATELAYRFAKNALHIQKPKKPSANKFALANNAQQGHISINGVKINIITRYYPTGSTTPPVNGSIISQKKGLAPQTGQVSIAKKVVSVNTKTVDVYLFEQNWITTSLDDIGQVAHSRKITFIKNIKGEWHSKGNTVIGWLNPEKK